jgi:uncharacterized cofD-like protein
MLKQPRIVLFGGGTGSFTLLQGLKKLTPHLTAIVSMSDDGGSTGILRDELGVLPPGDVRQCLVALSDLPEVRDLFGYRFEAGRLKGQSLGNIILSGLELQYGNFEDAVRIAGDLLHSRGAVVPVTFDKHVLVVDDGSRVHRGEHIIDGPLPLSTAATVRLEPLAQLNPQAREAIMAADMIIIAPGSLHTSLLPILAVSGMAAALKATPAKVVSVTNLINKPGQTDDWHVVDYAKQLERYMGDGVLDVVLYNSEPITDTLLQKYASEGEFPVRIELERFTEITDVRMVDARLVSREIATQSAASDVVRRTLIRHDADAVCYELIKLLRSA